MPKTLTYPQSSQSKALVLAQAVNSLGGTCTQELAAEKIGMKKGGGFSAVVSAASKYGLVISRRGELQVSSLFRELNHAYSEEETKEFLRQSLLTVPVYAALFERFKGSHLPIEILDKLLIREMDVDQNWASKVTKYFITDAKKCGLLDEDGTLRLNTENSDDDALAQNQGNDELTPTTPPVEEPQPEVTLTSNLTDEFVVSIQGPGMNTSISISDEDDMVIVEATLNKIRKKMAAE